MRKEKVITVDDRGNKLTFKIREMPATRLESWIVRASLLLVDSGILDGVGNAGDAMSAAGKALADKGLAALGGIDYAKAEPLLNELLGCCYHVGDGFEHQLTPEVTDGVIEDVRTLFTLRKEALALNFDFFAIAGPSGTGEAQGSQQAGSGRRISVRSKRS